MTNISMLNKIYVMIFPIKIKTNNFEYFHNPIYKGVFIKNSNNSPTFRDYLIEERIFNTINLNNIFTKELSGNNIENAFFNTNGIIFELTETCNLKCVYCCYGSIYEDENQKRDNKNISETLVINFLEYYFSRTKDRIADLNISFYGGEPLLRIKLISNIINFIKKIPLPYNITYSMTTNGLLLKKNIDFIVKNNIRILISFDGDQKGNSYRFNKTIYEELHKDIIYIKNKYPKFYNEKINFNSVLHNRNSLKDVYYFIKNNFEKIPLLATLKDIEISENSALIMSGLNDIEIKSFFEYDENIQSDLMTQFAEINDLVKFIRNNLGIIYENIDELVTSSGFNEKIPTATCIPFAGNIFITAQGKVLPCEQIPQKFLFSEISENRIEIDFENIANKHNKNLEIIKKKCSTCYNAFNCPKCIYMLDDLKCNSYADSEKYSEKISKYLENLETNKSLTKKITYGE